MDGQLPSSEEIIIGYCVLKADCELLQVLKQQPDFHKALLVHILQQADHHSGLH